MRIKRLDLKAFGPFSDKTLVLASREPGLHIIFGPNEAGKSSALRALKALLYGFPQQTPDNFLHSYDQLLVGGCLQGMDGREITFQRRKRRIADVIDGHGNPMGSDSLAPFLHGVEPEIFESLYGIDHNTLVQGGQAILDQKGEVGQALFAAGAGISSLRAVIEELEKEAAELFKPAGHLPEINKAVKIYKELQKSVKDLSLSSREWKEHQKRLRNGEQERKRLEQQRNEMDREMRRLERLARAIPELASLKNLREQFQALGEVILLPPDFSEQYRKIDQEVRTAGLQLRKDTSRLADLEDKRKAISLNKDLLGQAEVVEDLHQRLGEFRKGQKDRPERNGMRISLRRDAALQLKQVRPDLPLDAIETLRPVLGKKRTVQALSTQYEAIRQQLVRAEKQARVAQQEFQAIEQSLASRPAARDGQGLARAVKLAQKAGEIDALLDSNRREIEDGKKACRAGLKRIGLWAGDLAALMEVELPLPETVKQFENSFSEIADERRDLRKERREAERELADARAELRKMKYLGETPSEEELNRVREKRDHGWQLLRLQWLEQEDVVAQSRDYDPELPLPDAYEKYVGRADFIADRLRREAERVANAATLHARVETLEEFLADNHKRQEMLDGREQALHEAWIGIWQQSGISPLAPKEMAGWLTEMDKLRFRVNDIFTKERTFRKEEKRRLELRQAVLRELAAIEEKRAFPGEELAPVLVFAESILAELAAVQSRLERLAEEKQKAGKALEQAVENLDTAKEALAGWQTSWQESLADLGLQRQVSTLEAVDLFETLQSCFDKLNEAEELQKRIDGIDRDADELEADVRALLEKVAGDLLDQPIERSIVQLQARLTTARKDGALHDKISEELDLLRVEVEDGKKTLQSLDEQMQKLLRIAGCERPEDLAPIIGKSLEYQRLQEKISDAETTLAKIGAGASIEELAGQAAAVDADELPEQIASRKRDIEERIYPEINRISQIIGEETKELQRMDGNDRAAAAAEKMEQELARVRRLAERYVRVKLASRVLQQEIERYRAEHQDPVLKIASGYFSALTLGSFAGLRTDVDDRGEPVLVGLRLDETRVSVEGMSSGTRDQLFLALRLATLEWRLGTGEPMPFVVDDILINFDDERSGATLKVLAGLGMKNQILLFTHHRQIVQEARRLAGELPVHIHELD